MGRPRQLKGLRLLVTGASQGIGKDLVLGALRRGARVLAVARSLDLLQELDDEVEGQGVDLVALAGDVTVPADRQRMLETAQTRFGGLDVLINNAGIGATGHFAEAAPNRLRKIMEVNLFGVTEMTRLFLPVLRQGVTPAIVNISSIAGKRALPARSEYCASKFAVQGFSQALRAELVKDGIDVLVVCPGLTRTNFSRNMIEQKAMIRYDHLRGMASWEVADATLAALEQGRNETCLTPNGNLLVLVNRFFPAVVNWVARLMVTNLFGREIKARERARYYDQPQPPTPGA